MFLFQNGALIALACLAVSTGYRLSICPFFTELDKIFYREPLQLSVPPALESSCTCPALVLTRTTKEQASSVGRVVGPNVVFSNLEPAAIIGCMLSSVESGQGSATAHHDDDDQHCYLSTPRSQTLRDHSSQ